MLFNKKLTNVLFLFLAISLVVYIYFPKKSLSSSTIGTWSLNNTLNDSVASQYGFTNGNRIYSIGGANSVTIYSGEYSNINTNGTLNNWVNLTNRQNIFWHSGVVNNNFIYTLGGANSNRANMNKVYISQINSNGDISAWNETTPLPLSLTLGGAVVYNNKIYYAGGSTNGETSSNSKSEIYKSEINNDGTLGAWSIAGYLPHQMLGFGLIEHNGYIIVLGGKTLGETYLSEVQKAKINLVTGNVEQWEIQSPLPDPVYRSGVTKVQNLVVSAGGYNISPSFTLMDKVNFAEIGIIGTINSWTTSTNSLIHPNCCMALTSWNNFIYEQGGWTGNYTNEVNTAEVNIITPSSTPTVIPTPSPTTSPTPVPTATPTIEPTASPTSTPVLPVLSVPSLKQYSTPWGNKIYDHTKNTIHEFGCALTSAVMVLQYHGHIVLPDTLNNWLNNQSDGYIRNGLINWLAVSRYTKLHDSTNSPTLEYKRLEPTKGDLDNELNSNRPAILKENGHFVVATGKTNNSYLINDPGYASRNTLEPYGNTYLAINSYTPTHSDLSYMMFVVDPDINIEIKDSNGLLIPAESYIDEPINGLTNPNIKSGETVKIILFEKPETGDYKLLVSGPKGKYQLNSYLYDVNGNVNQNKFNGEIKSNETDKYNISFSSEKEKIKKSKRILDVLYWHKFFSKFFEKHS
ncbi:MAG: C39 family peptidase [Microgenomates group bacterium]